MCCISCIFGSAGLLSFSAKAVSLFQNFCSLCLETNSPSSTLSRALLCGNRSVHLSLKEQLTQFSLIHLLVVSGFHLHLVAQALEFALTPLGTKKARFALGLILGLFVALAGAQAPLVRALMTWLVLQLSRKYKLGFSPLHLCALSALLCLLFEPSWLVSFSFILSFSAAFAIALAREMKLRCALKISSLVYLCLLIPLLPLQAPHPLTALGNALLALPLGVGLVLGALISALIPPAESYFLEIITYLELALTQLGGPLRSADSIGLKSPLWPYLAGLIGLCLFLPKRLNA